MLAGLKMSSVLMDSVFHSKPWLPRKRGFATA
jgi:hypothetical protein